MRPRPSLRRARIIVCGAAFFLAGVELLGCDPTPPIDLHFDSSLGADFKPPPPQEDAGVGIPSDAGEAGAP
jgi:hypothetical protein